MRCHSRDTAMPSRRFVCAAVCEYLNRISTIKSGDLTDGRKLRANFNFCFVLKLSLLV